MPVIRSKKQVRPMPARVGARVMRARAGDDGGAQGRPAPRNARAGLPAPAQLRTQRTRPPAHPACTGSTRRCMRRPRRPRRPGRSCRSRSAPGRRRPRRRTRGRAQAGSPSWRPPRPRARVAPPRRPPAWRSCRGKAGARCGWAGGLGATQGARARRGVRRSLRPEAPPAPQRAAGELTCRPGPSARRCAGPSSRRPCASPRPHTRRPAAQVMWGGWRRTTGGAGTGAAAAARRQGTSVHGAPAVPSTLSSAARSSPLSHRTRSPP